MTDKRSEAGEPDIDLLMQKDKLPGADATAAHSGDKPGTGTGAAGTGGGSMHQTGQGQGQSAGKPQTQPQE